MADVKRYTATFLGESFPFVSDEPEELVHSYINLVDRLLREAVQQAPLLDQRRALYLVVLQLAQRSTTQEAHLDSLRDQCAQTVAYAQKLLHLVPEL